MDRTLDHDKSPADYIKLQITCKNLLSSICNDLVGCEHDPGSVPFLTGRLGKIVVFTTDPSNIYTMWKCSPSLRKVGAVLVSVSFQFLWEMIDLVLGVVFSFFNTCFIRKKAKKGVFASSLSLIFLKFQQSSCLFSSRLLLLCYGKNEP